MFSTVGRACLEGRSPSLLGKDEVASSNLASSSIKRSKPFGFDLFRFYVNSWGRAKNEIVTDRVGAKAPARLLCITKENSFSEVIEITHSERNSFQDLSFVVTAFNIAIRPWNIHGVENFLKPITISFDTIIELL